MLAPKEHWQNHISQIQFPGWLNHASRPILWIGGKENRRGFSWVSSFSLDLIEALEMEPSVTIAYILCEAGPDESRFSPLNIFKNILIQVLNANPDILHNPQNFFALPLPIFEQVGESTDAAVAFRLLGKFLKMVDELFARSRRELFILIDRVDVVLGMVDEPRRFLQALKRLNAACERVRIVLTSREKAEDTDGGLLGEKGKGEMMEVWVDTRRSLPMELDYEYD